MPLSALPVRTLAEALDSSPTALLIVDADDVVGEANAALLARLGRAADDVVGRPLADLGAPLEALREATAEARRSGALATCGGDHSALPLGEGRVLLTVGDDAADPDPTAAPAPPRAEEVLASISDAFFALDRDWRFAYVNEQAEPLLDRRREDLLGKNVWEVFPEAVGTRFWEAYHEAVETGEPVYFDAFFEPLTRYFSVRAYPFGGGLSVYFTDITTSREADRARALLAAIVESSDDAIVSKNLDGIITSWNGGAERILGYTAAEAIGQPVLMLIPPERHDEEHMILDQIRRGIRIEHFETIRQAKGGRLLDVAITVSPLRDGEGRVVGASKVLRDVTEQKRAAAALRESEDRYRTLFESVDEGFCIIEMIYDEAGRPIDYRFLETNPAFKAQTGLHDTVGRRMRELVPAHEQSWFDTYGAVARTGEPARFTNEAAALGRWYDVYATRLGGPESDRVAVLFDDVTERRRTEAALRASEARYRFLGESLQQQIWTAEPDGQLDYVNRFVLDYFGRSIEAMLGAGWQDAVHPDDLADVAERWGHSIQTGEPYRTEFRLLRASDQTYRWHVARADALVEDGRLVKWFGANVDVHEQKEAEVALRQSEERSRLALDASRLGLWTWDPATDEGTQDARTQAILSLAPDEQLTMTEALARIVHPDDLPTVQAALAAALDPEGDGRAELEWRVPRPAEGPCWVRATARTAFHGPDDDRRPTQMIGTLADVTAQKETERELLAVIDGLPELAWSARPDGHIDFYNERWYDYTGTTFEEIEGWGWERVHDPAVLPEVVARWRHSLATGEPFEMEFPLRGADGAFQWFLTRATPLRDADGQITRWIGVNTDVHDKRRAETQARFLAESGQLAEEALDFDATLDRLADLAVPGFADWCSISLRHDDGSIKAVAIAHADPEKVRWGWELQDVRPVDPDDPTGVPNVLRTGQSEFYPDIPDELLVASVDDPEELALLREIGFSSVLIVPMAAGEEIIGAVSFVNTESGRHFDEADLAAAEEVGRRAGSALETARLYQALQRSEAAAREAEARTRALFDAAPDVVLVYPIGPDGPEPLIDVNEAAVETYGYPRETLLQMRPTELHVPGTVSVPDAIARLRQQGTARFEAVHRTREGREIPMDVIAHLIERGGREVVLSVCRDVTERREAERALLERERELQTLANSIPQMAWMADADGAVLWFNRRWYDYTGTSPDDAADPDMAPLLHPDDAERVAASYVAAFETGEPWEDTFRIRSADGGYRWFLSRALPIHEPGSRTPRWFGTNTDVTEQRALLAERDEAVDRLRQSQERHTLALEGGGMGTWEWDIPEGRLDGDERVYRLWGTRPGTLESLAAFYDRLVHPDDLGGLQDEVGRTLADGEDYAAEFRIVRPDGHVRWLANRGRIVRDAAGAPVRMFGLSYDVTERRESEEALRQKNAEMEQFAYTISHDLKSPLVTITGFLGVLKGQVAAGRTDRALASVDRVLGAADRMGRLIEDLLHLSRAGRVTGDAAPVDLDALLGGLADGFTRRVREAGGALAVEAPLGRVLADERRLGEVVENLLANAVRYGLGGGGTQITVRTESGSGGVLRLVVEDDGPGVPAAYRRKVFELFQRLDSSGEGTGVGLALVARIMEVTGGQAYVESAGGPPDHEGARFVLEFPASAVLVRPASATEPATARTATGSHQSRP